MTDLADRPDVSPELRLVPHAFRETFGRPAEGVWYAPGVVGLMPGACVCARWGAIVAGERRTDGVLELVSINKPAEPVRMSLSRFTSVDVPRWARPVARIVERLEPGGATLLCSVDLPAGSGLSSPNALACAAALALRDLCRREMPLGHLVDLVRQCSSPDLVEAAFAGYSTGVDLAGAALLVIDTRVRADVPVALRDAFSPAGDLGCRLTAYHRAQASVREQDMAVEAALAGGALGASMLVDEPGRPAVALTQPPRLSTVRAYVSDAFRCDQARAPRYLTIRPAAGTTRISP
jgi:hypothetical protein